MALKTGHKETLHKPSSIPECLQELRYVKTVLEQVEMTNEEVLKGIESRARRCLISPEAKQKITDLKDQVRKIGHKMDERETHFKDLRITVNKICGKVDDLIRGISTEETKINVNENECNGKDLLETDGVVNRKTTKNGRSRIIKHSSHQKESLITDGKQEKCEVKSDVIRTLKTTQEASLPCLPPMRTIGGLKSRLTLDSCDNRLNQAKLSERTTNMQKEQTLSLPDSEQNISNRGVLIRKQDAKYEREFASMPGLSTEAAAALGSDSFIAGLVWQEWHTYAEAEKNKGMQGNAVRGQGPDVVLCLDISGSMEGEPFQAMMTFAIDYVNGVEQMSHTIGINENISVTTFGYITKVWIHLTNDYSAVKAVLNEIKALVPRGRSPIGGGILVALAGCLGNYDIISIIGVPILPRVLLLSDGKGTPDHIKEGPELMQESEEDMHSRLRVDANLEDVAKNLKRRKNPIHCVPMGNANEKSLSELSKITDGLIFKPYEMNRLLKWSRMMIRAADLYRKSERLIQGKSPEESNAMLRAVVEMQEISAEEKEDLISIMKTFGVPKLSEEDVTSEHDDELLSLGTRVRRGRGWHYPDEQDSRGPGTVCSHGQTGMLWVEWDNGKRNCYNYKHGAKEVEVVTERRVLKPDELIAPGIYVKRGKNWQHSDEDGGVGSTGIVTRVRQDGTVIVRWPNKSIKEYRFGADGIFELQVCTDEPSTSPASEPEGYVAPAGDGLRIESFLPPVRN